MFTGRVLLAALDRNFYVFRKTLEGQFKKIYSKRSGNWTAELVKEPKQDEYFALLQADILRRRAEDTEPVTRHELAHTTLKESVEKNQANEEQLTSTLTVPQNQQWYRTRRLS